MLRWAPAAREMRKGGAGGLSQLPDRVVSQRGGTLESLAVFKIRHHPC